jgi:hypothetical protein
LLVVAVVVVVVAECNSWESCECDICVETIGGQSGLETCCEGSSLLCDCKTLLWTFTDNTGCRCFIFVIEMVFR